MPHQCGFSIISATLSIRRQVALLFDNRVDKCFTLYHLLRLIAYILLHLQYGPNIQSLCDRNDLIGRMAQVYFAPPLPKGSKMSSPISLTQRQTLQTPRLSLRLLASYRTLVYLGLLYLVLSLWRGISPVGYLFCLIGLVLLYGFLHALTHRSSMKMN